MLGISAIWYHLVIVLHAHFPWSTLDPGAVFCKLFWTVYEFWKIKISLADKIECATFCFTMLSGWLAVGLFFSIKKSALEMVNLTNETVFYSILFSIFFSSLFENSVHFPNNNAERKELIFNLIFVFRCWRSLSLSLPLITSHQMISTHQTLSAEKSEPFHAVTIEFSSFFSELARVYSSTTFSTTFFIVSNSNTQHIHIFFNFFPFVSRSSNGSRFFDGAFFICNLNFNQHLFFASIGDTITFSSTVLFSRKYSNVVVVGVCSLICLFLCRFAAFNRWQTTTTTTTTSMTMTTRKTFQNELKNHNLAA